MAESRRFWKRASTALCELSQLAYVLRKLRGARQMTWTTFDVPEARCRACGAWTESDVINLPGEGDLNAEIVLVGEALGADEEELQANFIGRAGDLLTFCLESAGLVRSACWVCNSVRCRPIQMVRGNRKNRTPTPHEIDCCNGWLLDELAKLPNKKIIVALGGVPMKALLGPMPGGVLEHQGKVMWSDRLNCHVLTTVHPAYLLRRQGEIERLITDLTKAKEIAEHGVQPPAPVEYHVIGTLGELYQLRDYILQHPEVAFDWETSGLHLVESRGLCCSFSVKEREAFVVPRYQSGFELFWPSHDLAEVDRVLAEILTHQSVKKFGHHVAFDNCISRSTVGVWPTPVSFCTMIGHHTLNNHLGERSHGLKVMADLYTDMGRYDDPLDQWLLDNGHKTDKGRPDYGFLYMAPNELVWYYACSDADATFRLRGIVEERLEKSGLLQVFQEERLPLLQEQQEMDRIGVRINVNRLREISEELSHALQMVETNIETLVGHPVNPASPKQVTAALFDELGLPVLGWTEHGEPSTAEEYLKPLEDLHDVIPMILQYRAYQKIKGTYVDGKSGDAGLLAVVDADEYARTNTRIHGTETFRLVTRKPFPLHTWPKTHAGFPSVRALIIPDPGYKFISGDFVQQEFVIQAILAEQEDIVEAMLDRREDVHEMVMRELGGPSRSDFLDAAGKWQSEEAENEYKIHRSRFKSINFMMLYRGGFKKLAKILNIGEPEASDYIVQYGERFDKIRLWQYGKIKEVRETGEVREVFGTRRKLPAIFDPLKWSQLEAERAACNFPIQRGGAAVLARALLRVARRFRQERLPGRVVFSVHDQLIVQVRDDLVTEGSAIMIEEMTRPFDQLRGRGIHVDLSVTDYWGG